MKHMLHVYKLFCNDIPTLGHSLVNPCQQGMFKSSTFPGREASMPLDAVDNPGPLVFGQRASGIGGHRTESNADNGVAGSIVHSYPTRSRGCTGTNGALSRFRLLHDLHAGTIFANVCEPPFDKGVM